jgi:hypothetical protein
MTTASCHRDRFRSKAFRGDRKLSAGEPFHYISKSLQLRASVIDSQLPESGRAIKRAWGARVILQEEHLDSRIADWAKPLYAKGRRNAAAASVGGGIIIAE